MKKHRNLQHARSLPISMKLLSGALLSLSLMTHSVAQATERESLEQLRNTTVNLVRLLVQEGVLSKDKAEQLIKQARKKAKQAPAKYATPEEVAEAEKVGKAIDKEMVRIQYVPEHIKEEMREDIEAVVMQNLNYKADERLGLPGWIDRLHWEGDVRLRYEKDIFGSNNPTITDYRAANFQPSGDDNPSLQNTTKDRDRFRVRARLALTADISDSIKGGMRITTGSLRDPLSHNQTQEAGTGKYTLGLDRAYLKADVKPWLSLVGGRFQNPFFHTDLVWDPDLAFDGIAASFTPKINDRLSAFVTAGIFPVEEIEESSLVKSKDKWLYGAQAGISWKATDKANVKLGVALYEFDNIESELNPTGNTIAFNESSPSYRRKGNTAFDINRNNNSALVFEPFGLASEFKELNVTGEVNLAIFDPVHITLTGDYVKNIGFDEDDVRARTGLAVDENTDAYQARLTVGMPRIEKAHDWRTYFAYKYLEADAVVDAFTDSNFFLGGTNAKGWVVEGNYGIDKNTWLSARWLSAEELDPRGGLRPLDIDVFLLDINTRF